MADYKKTKGKDKKPKLMVREANGMIIFSDEKALADYVQEQIQKYILEQQLQNKR